MSRKIKKNLILSALRNYVFLICIPTEGNKISDTLLYALLTRTHAHNFREI